MFGIGPQEIVMIVIAALVIFGPQRLPEIAAQAGKALRDFRRMKDELTGELRQSLTLDDPTAPDRPLTDTVAAASSTPGEVGSSIAQSLRLETIPTETSMPVDFAYTPTPMPTNCAIALDAEPAITGEADAVRAQGGIADARDAAINTEATSGGTMPHMAADLSTKAPVPHVTGPLTYSPPQREPADPQAESTIREKIEAEVAAEAFRERRRGAHYQRARKRG